MPMQKQTPNREATACVAGWCAECGAEAQWATLESAEAMSGLSVGLIRRWAEAGRLHLAEDTEGKCRVCLNSPLIC